MQTNFSTEQMLDPAIQSSNGVLRTCVHCGMCTATCPTFLLLGDELDSPRGRIYLIKDMLESGRPATEEVVRHVDRCLSCLSCMSTCPSGVNYMHLVDHAREYIENTYTRPWHERMLRNILTVVLPRPALFRASLISARLAKPFRALVPRTRVHWVSASTPCWTWRPPSLPPMGAMQAPQVHAPQGERRGRVALLAGCAQKVLDPAINEATIRLLTRMGIEVVIARGAGCCGALTHHMGRHDPAMASATRQHRRLDPRDGWRRPRRHPGQYQRLRHDGEGLRLHVPHRGAGPEGEVPSGFLRWQRTSREYLAGLDYQPTRVPSPGLRVAYHSACSLQHGQRITSRAEGVAEACRLHRR